MKKYTSVFSLLIIFLAIYWSFRSSMPVYKSDAAVSDTLFSADRALTHVKAISQKPHAVGFPAHVEVRNYIVSELEKMGLQTSIQVGYTAGDWANLSKVYNILARIEGTGEGRKSGEGTLEGGTLEDMVSEGMASKEMASGGRASEENASKGKTLLLLSHYDSSTHSSLGASDAGSGVATILEGVRAFLSQNKKAKNDIIILLSDAEELGLNGADLFVNEHPWADEIGLVLNFEARGSGGPSYLLIETNRGNTRLIEEFTKAQPKYPVANSLTYSLYKMLPNDTDLTVFREDADIEGLNFAFIDDHYDYHTVRDNYQRLNRNTLAHQGSYLMPLLEHFGNTDLNDLKSLNDYVYFNMPFFGLVSYPFDWIWPMFALSLFILIVLLIYGFRKKALTATGVLKGFVPLMLCLAINGAVGFFSWSALQWLYPAYTDMLHGFTYNGHMYIAAFILFSTGICFWIYHLFRNSKTPDLLVAPLVLWSVICWGVSTYLQGAAFFIVPLLAVLFSFWVTLDHKRPNPYVLVLLAVPALWIFPQFIWVLPIGLGLKMMAATTCLVTLTFFLLMPVFGYYGNKKALSILSLALFVLFMASAHFSSGFSPENAKPSSLLYVLDGDRDSARWATYDQVLIDWNEAFLGNNPRKPGEAADGTFSSKYGSGFSYMAEAPIKEIRSSQIERIQDTVIGEKRWLEIQIAPQRNVNRLEIFTNGIDVSEAIVNDLTLSSFFLQDRKNNRLLTHYISDNDTTRLRLAIPKDAVLELTFYEASNDLLEHPLFEVPERPENSIPMPFVLNDAILTVKTIKFE